MSADRLDFTVPSKGRIGEQTMAMLARCGLAVSMRSPRSYAGTVPALPGVAAHLQRASDIVEQVRSGNADLGITGRDILAESGAGSDEVVVLWDDLGYSRARLAIAVPDAWVDVVSVADLAEVALELRGGGRALRVATSFPALTRNFLIEHGVYNLRVVNTSGSVEAAPSLGSADIVCDIVETGSALRQNRLRELPDGVVMRSAACLIGNVAALRADSAKRELAGRMLEYIEAHLAAAEAYTITANVSGASPEAVAASILGDLDLSGIKGPTVSPVYEKSGQASWYAITVTIARDRLIDAVAHLRSAGAASIIARRVDYLFGESSAAKARMLEKLGIGE
ncbi:MAG: ATP phosphoribosyltransferase [Chloroflexota bacterium]|nr:ATP phosphoribosyltransferase [Chloroflexota bacterium]